MPLYTLLIVALWLLFVVFWAVSAVYAKPTLGGARRWRREIAWRLALIGIVILALRVSVIRHALRSARIHWVNTSAPLGFLGVALAMLGIGLAIWARVHLGRNWGLPKSRKADPALVTSGPYAFLRHPIYGGIILALLGSTIGESLLWAIPLVLSAGYFMVSARREEHLMIAQFPDAYRAYMKRTKRLIPFVW